MSLFTVTPTDAHTLYFATELVKSLTSDRLCPPTIELTRGEHDYTAAIVRRRSRYIIHAVTGTTRTEALTKLVDVLETRGNKIMQAKESYRMNRYGEYEELGEFDGSEEVDDSAESDDISEVFVYTEKCVVEEVDEGELAQMLAEGLMDDDAEEVVPRESLREQMKDTGARQPAKKKRGLKRQGVVIDAPITVPPPPRAGRPKPRQKASNLESGLGSKRGDQGK